MKYFIILLFFSVINSNYIFAKENNNSNIDDKTVKSGFAIQLGNGLMYSGLGGEIEYQIPIYRNFRFVPYTGLGFSLGGTDISTNEYYWLNYTLGLNFEYGENHRFIFGSQLLGFSNLFNKPTDAVIYKKNNIAPVLIIGYKHTNYYGWIIQFNTGITYIQNPLIKNANYSFEPTIGLGLGYKL